MVNVYDVACSQFTEQGSNIVYDPCMTFPYDPAYDVVYDKKIFGTGYPAITIRKSYPAITIHKRPRDHHTQERWEGRAAAATAATAAAAAAAAAAAVAAATVLLQVGLMRRTGLIEFVYDPCMTYV